MKEIKPFKKQGIIFHTEHNTSKIPEHTETLFKTDVCGVNNDNKVIPRPPDVPIRKNLMS